MNQQMQTQIMSGSDVTDELDLRQMYIALCLKEQDVKDFADKMKPWNDRFSEAAIVQNLLNIIANENSSDKAMEVKETASRLLKNFKADPAPVKKNSFA